MRWISVMIAAGLVSAPLAGAVPHAETGDCADEILRYEWRLQGLVGAVAGLFFPRAGHGELRRAEKGPVAVNELEVTSPERAEGAYFLYGAEVGARGWTERAWSGYRWRGKEKLEKAAVEEPGVLDVASAIQRIREKGGTEPFELRIWSDGKIYPVEVVPGNLERVEVPTGRYLARHYRVQGRDVPGERYWEGGLELWVSRSRGAIPVRIVVERGWVTLHLELTGRKGDRGEGPGPQEPSE